MVELDAFEWNDDQGPFGKSYDLLGDGSIQLINIPGHADGLVAVKVINEKGKFALLFSDGGYAARSWQEQITSGIAADKEQQNAGGVHQGDCRRLAPRPARDCAQGRHEDEPLAATPP